MPVPAASVDTQQKRNRGDESDGAEQQRTAGPGEQGRARERAGVVQDVRGDPKDGGYRRGDEPSRPHAQRAPYRLFGHNR